MGRATYGVVVLACTFVACASDSTPGADSGSTTQPRPAPVAVPEIVATRAAQVPGALDQHAARSLSDGLVQVDDAGRLWLEFHASRSVQDADAEALTALGASITARTATVVAAWVPYDRIDEAAALRWVVAVRPVETTVPD